MTPHRGVQGEREKGEKSETKREESKKRKLLGMRRKRGFR